jgi:hypothetical protein
MDDVLERSHDLIEEYLSSTDREEIEKTMSEFLLNQEELDPEYVELVNDNFWELIDG